MGGALATCFKCTVKSCYTSAGTCPAGALSPAHLWTLQNINLIFSHFSFSLLLFRFALLPLKLIMRLRSICSSSALVRTGRGSGRGGGSAKVSTERQRQVKDLRVATTPFALCVKRSEVNLAKVEGDGEREGRDKGRGRTGGHDQRRFHNVSKLNRTQGGKGKGRRAQLSYKPSQLLGMLFLLQHILVAHTCCCCCCRKHVALTL